MGHLQPTAHSPQPSVARHFATLGAVIGLLAAALPGPLAAQGNPRNPRPAARSPLPAIPLVSGPLAIRVVYPSPTDRFDAPDSSFIFGSVGDGRARLTINGQLVRVAPNGAFLGWVSFPADTLMALELVATRGADTARLVYRVQRAPRFVPPDSGIWLDTTSVTPRGRVWWPEEEMLPVTLRASPGAEVSVILADGERIRLTNDSRLADVPWGTRAFEIDTTKLRRAVATDRYAGLLPTPRVLRGDVMSVLELPLIDYFANLYANTIEVVLGADTLHWSWRLRGRTLSGPATVVSFDDDTARTGETDRITVGRALPGGTYHYFFPTGTRAEVTARVNNDVRVRLSEETSAWVSGSDAVASPAGFGARGAVVGSVRISRAPDRVVLRIPVTWRVPFRVNEEDRRLTLTLFGAQGDVNWIQYGPADPLVAQVQWNQRTADEVAITVDLSQAVWGYRTRWDNDDLILEIKRPPRIDANRPLRGLKVVVDAGHPPVGATGPTGFREAEANLAVAKELAAMLRAGGATVLMTRSADVPLDLWPRIRMADSADADLLVSIHNNALPDGVNPFTNHGTSVYYNQPRSLPWARTVETALVRRLGLPELGVGRGDLAMVRPTWMPSILTEGMFMMIPEQEYALRSSAGQRLYAQAVYDGTLAFLRGRAGR
jgi:N-acetylmuramoyl-L-alanine amidase